MMTRRGFLAAVGGALAVGARAIALAGSAPPYGYLDVSGHIAHRRATGEFLHVWYNGSNVTQQCTEADDIAGYVVLICRDSQHHRDWMRTGAYHLKGSSVCRLRLNGRVVIRPGTDPSPCVAIGPAQHTRWSTPNGRVVIRPDTDVSPSAYPDQDRAPWNRPRA